MKSQIIYYKLKNNLIRAKTEEPIILVHIGKCGGSSVRKELNNANIAFSEKHLCKIKYSISKRYIITIRNPIERFVSAFNWRYKLVCDDKTQMDRFKGEKELLEKFKTVNNLAENLYDKHGNLLINFQKNKHYIHHITEDINFYIGKFLSKCNKQNIMAVIATETIKEDLNYYFNIFLNSHNKNNSKKYTTYLSDLAYKNLKSYLKKDYECIEKLYQLNLISKEKYKVLSK